MNRPHITQDERDRVILMVREKLEFRMKQKGTHAYASIHEALGIITEEYYELQGAVMYDDQGAVVEELIDIAVGAIFGAACILAKKVDW